VSPAEQPKRSQLHTYQRVQSKTLVSNTLVSNMIFLLECLDIRMWVSARMPAVRM
jgi:hypothetical protein